MQNKLINIQIVLNGKFEPFSADPNNILEISTLLNEFQLFPKEVAEQRIEFSEANGQSISLYKSLELVSANRLNSLQVRREVLIYSTNIDSEDLVHTTFDSFIKILEKIKVKVNFCKASRLGLVKTTQYINEHIKDYKIKNNLSDEIIEHRNRIVFRQPLDELLEQVNFVKTTDFIAKEAGVPQNILNYSIDINTLSDKDIPRFEINHIRDFLTGAMKILKD